MMKSQKILSAALAAAMMASAGCIPAAAETAKPEAPKYVFLFIGDGMTYPQFQSAASYLGALKQEKEDSILKGDVKLNFMGFEGVGSVTTYDSTSFCPDSASTATSIASGHKTYSGVINMDETKTIPYTTIAEQLKKELGYEIGVISSVNLNHATPAAFYAHQPTRNNYYEIGLELIASNFDYFAGGSLKNNTGNKKDAPQEDLYDLAAAAGYRVVRTQAEAEMLRPEDGKAIVIAETLADSGSISYEIDRAETEWSLADYVRKGVEMLDNDTGFFLMTEGGKVDWACHANDAGSSIHDVLALAEAVDVALDFAKDHAEETLILVTGDHETGALSIGFAGTDYNTYLDNMQQQKISYAKFDDQYVKQYIANKTPFEEAMKDVQQLFGLTMPANAAEAANETLVLTDYEVEKIREGYEITLAGGLDKSQVTQEEYVAYGTYSPFSVSVTHVLNNKSGINFASYAHTGLPAAVYAKGVHAADFAGGYDNTQIYEKLANLFSL